MPQPTEENKPTLHYGRGGAGNTTAKSKDAPITVPEATPILKSQKYTTGRGGTGNMAKNDNAAEARAAQDVEVSDVLSSHNPHHVGRGGAANTYAPSEQASKQKEGKGTSGIQNLAEKAKETLTGRHK